MFVLPVPDRRMWPRAFSDVVVALVLAVLATGALGWSAALPAALAVAAVTAPLVETDLREQRLPNQLVLVALIGAAVTVALSGPSAQARALLAGIAGALVLLMLSAGGLGMGDVKLGAVLALGLGAVDPLLALGALALAFVLGAASAFVLIVARGWLPSARIAFGPPLLAAYWISLVLGGVP